MAHSPELPIPVPWNLDEDDVITNIEPCAYMSSDEERRDPDFLKNTYTELHLINQSELNRDRICQSQVEILASRLKGWNIL